MITGQNKVLKEPGNSLIDSTSLKRNGVALLHKTDVMTRLHHTDGGVLTNQQVVTRINASSNGIYGSLNSAVINKMEKRNNNVISKLLP